jgi:hypothetical protein
VMAFIDNELPVFGDAIIHNAPVSEALDHGDINDAQSACARLRQSGRYRPPTN